MALQNSSKNLADELLVYAKTLPILHGHIWEASLLLRIGASLAEAVNKFPDLSGEEKSELVCQTVLRLLDDGEKAEKERLVESTATETTKVPWEELRSVVKAVLPQTLTLIVKASRGEFDLSKIVPLAAPVVVSCCIPLWSGLFAKKTPLKVEKTKESLVFPNPLPLAGVPPKERPFLEVREPLPTQS